MTWHYQVIRKTRKHKGKMYHYYDVHEVFTDEDGSVSWTEEPVDCNNLESIKDVQRCLVTMLRDTIEYPVMEIRRGKLVSRNKTNTKEIKE